MVEKAWGNERMSKKNYRISTLKIQKSVHVPCTASKLVRGEQAPTGLEGQAARSTQGKSPAGRVKVPTPGTATLVRKGTDTKPLLLSSSHDTQCSSSTTEKQRLINSFPAARDTESPGAVRALGVGGHGPPLRCRLSTQRLRLPFT